MFEQHTQSQPAIIETGKQPVSIETNISDFADLNEFIQYYAQELLKGNSECGWSNITQLIYTIRSTTEEAEQFALFALEKTKIAIKLSENAGDTHSLSLLDLAFLTMDFEAITTLIFYTTRKSIEASLTKEQSRSANFYFMEFFTNPKLLDLYLNFLNFIACTEYKPFYKPTCINIVEQLQRMINDYYTLTIKSKSERIALALLTLANQYLSATKQKRRITLADPNETQRAKLSSLVAIFRSISKVELLREPIAPSKKIDYRAESDLNPSIAAAISACKKVNPLKELMNAPAEQDSTPLALVRQVTETKVSKRRGSKRNRLAATEHPSAEEDSIPFERIAELSLPSPAASKSHSTRSHSHGKELSIKVINDDIFYFHNKEEAARFANDPNIGLSAWMPDPSCPYPQHVYARYVAKLGGKEKSKSIGIFAKCKMKKLDRVGRYMGDYVPPHSDVQDGTFFFLYNTELNDGIISGRGHPGNFIPYVNHGTEATANCIMIAIYENEGKPDERVIGVELIATKEILPGQQLLYPYHDLPYTFYSNTSRMIYLNPGDNHLTISEKLTVNSEHYQIEQIGCDDQLRTIFKFDNGVMQLLLPKYLCLELEPIGDPNLNLIEFSQDKTLTDDSLQCHITSLMWACYHGKLSIVKALVRSSHVDTGEKCDIDRQCAHGKTALHYVILSSAADDVKLSIMQLLIKLKAKCFIGDENEETPLHLAIRTHQLQMVEALTVHDWSDKLFYPSSHRLQPFHDYLDNHDFDPLLTSIQVGAVDILKHLLNKTKITNAAELQNYLYYGKLARTNNRSQIRRAFTSLLIDNADQFEGICATLKHYFPDKLSSASAASSSMSEPAIFDFDGVFIPVIEQMSSLTMKFAGDPTKSFQMILEKMLQAFVNLHLVSLVEFTKKELASKGPTLLSRRGSAVKRKSSSGVFFPDNPRPLPSKSEDSIGFRDASAVGTFFSGGAISPPTPLVQSKSDPTHNKSSVSSVDATNPPASLDLIALPKSFK